MESTLIAREMVEDIDLRFLCERESENHFRCFWEQQELDVAEGYWPFMCQQHQPVDNNFV